MKKWMHKWSFLLLAVRWLCLGRFIVGVPSLNRQCGAIAGLRGTGDWGTDERPKSFRETILWRRPNGSAPLFALTAKMKSQAVNDPEFNWWEEELNAIRVQIAYDTGYATSDETLTIDSGDAQDLVAGDVLLVEAALTTGYTHEILVVSSVTSSTVFVAKRGQAGTTRAAIANNVYLTRIGTVFSEGSHAPDASSRNPTKLYNYCQIFKKSYEITGTGEQTEVRTGDPLQNDKKRRMFDYSVDAEFAFFFGKRYETTGANGKPMRFMGGILYMLSTYASSRIVAFTTTPTESTLLDAVYPIWDYDTDAGSERIVFAGNGFLNSLNKLAQAATSTRINFDGFVSVYGMRLQRWIFPQGEIYVRTHPLFNTHGRFTNDAVILDPSALIYRYLKNRDTKSKDHIEDPDQDSHKGQWIGEFSLEMHHAKTSLWLSNFVVP